MTRFFFQFAGRPRDTVGMTCIDLAEARTRAVQLLAERLAHQPTYAEEGHWRVTVEDDCRRPLLNVIVATVAARGAPREPSLEAAGE